MILDYTYSRNKKNFSISYIKEDGMKSLLKFNVSRFKTYKKTPTGTFENWDGSKCDVAFTENPSKFDYRIFMKDLDEKYKKLIDAKYAPKVYTFDIETMIVNDEFPEPSEAKFPITTISIANPECKTIILGTRELDENGQKYLQEEFSKYVNDTEYFRSLDVDRPTIQYIKFDNEESMLRYFLKNIVAKVPILAGWNSIMFDWQYIMNRIKFYYPDIPFNTCSCNWTTHRKAYENMRGDKVVMELPDHTLIVDMMDVVGTFDMVVMPIKDSLSLDYIASESIGANKIKYDGSLQDLYDNDYPKYVFYNAIDSFLVQLINKRFKTLNSICTQSLICEEKIENCFSKIAISEALFWNYFYDHNIKVVYERKEDVHRGTLIGAYVRIPTPGKHNYICCNDFASLYPSTIISCNLSVENFIGGFFDEKALEPYRLNLNDYIVVGGCVYKNNGKIDKPSLGEFVDKFLDEKALEPYRKDPNYFVSVNGCVYKNDKAYAFKNIQLFLKESRNSSKYLSKQLEAEIITDIDHVIKGHASDNTTNYPDNIIHAISKLGYNVTNIKDLIEMDKEVLIKFKRDLQNEIIYLTSAEQAYKYLMNSLYGGSSHVAFFWFNMFLANDITGEARNIIHKMEYHIPEYIREQWPKMTDFHKKYNIELDQNKVKDILAKNNSFVNIAYGDTDSCLSDSLLRCYDRLSKSKLHITIEDLYNEMSDKGYTLRMTDRQGTEFCACDKQILNWDADKGLYYSDVKYIMRHKVTKPKWRLRTKDGKEVIVTNDHSMIVFRDGEKLEIKPNQILPTDKVLIVENQHTMNYEIIEIESCECIGEFVDEYVYDIEMDDPTHTFIANDILVHNSLYISYENIINSIKDNDKLSLEDKTKLIVDLNTGYLDRHNREYMQEYYKTRHVDSVQNFELETVALSGVWLDVKKRYAQILLWKDGKTYDIDDLPLKVKGLEIVKSSYPKEARKELKHLVRYLLEDSNSDGYLLQRLSIEVQKMKQQFNQAPIEEICGNMKVNGYTKYIENDKNPSGLEVAPKCPSNVRALGTYNWLRNVYNLPGDPIYGGKLKWYRYYPVGRAKDPEVFAFQAGNYPKWADKYAPISRIAMFNAMVLDPFNRILSAIGMNELSSDGSIQLSLF